MSKPNLSPEQEGLFQEAIWRLMGRMQDSRWRDMLDPSTPLGQWVRGYYRSLAATGVDDDPADLLEQAAQASLFDEG